MLLIWCLTVRRVPNETKALFHSCAQNHLSLLSVFNWNDAIGRLPRLNYLPFSWLWSHCSWFSRSHYHYRCFQWGICQYFSIFHNCWPNHWRAPYNIQLVQKWCDADSFRMTLNLAGFPNRFRDSIYRARLIVTGQLLGIYKYSVFNRAMQESRNGIITVNGKFTVMIYISYTFFTIPFLEQANSLILRVETRSM